MSSTITLTPARRDSHRAPASTSDSRPCHLRSAAWQSSRQSNFRGVKNLLPDAWKHTVPSPQGSMLLEIARRRFLRIRRLPDSESFGMQRTEKLRIGCVLRPST